MEKKLRICTWTMLAALVWGALLMIVSEIYRLPTSDNYFMLAHSKLIHEQGFVTTEMLRMHKGFQFVIPQWLYAEFFSFCINVFGTAAGYKLAGFLTFGTLILVLFTMITFLYKKSAECLLYGMLMLGVTFLFFNGVRPFYFTVSILMIETIFLEQYVKTKKMMFLFVLPFLSIVLINVHNSLWVGFFLVLLCYLVESAIQSIRNHRFEVGKLLLVTGVSALAGLINPYGLDYILYIVNSMDSVKPLIGIIGELTPLYQNASIPFLLFFAGITIYFFVHIKQLPIRMILLFFGFALASILYKRNLILFFTIGQLGMYWLLQKPSKKTIFRTAKYSYFLLALSFLILFCTCKTNFYSGRSFYQAIDQIDATNHPSIFCTVMDAGSYATMKGCRPYIDGCAEIYGIKNNKQENIAKEFAEFSMEKIDELIEKYQFDYLLLYDKIHHKNYELIGVFNKDSMGQEDNTYYLYKATVYPNVS